MGTRAEDLQLGTYKYGWHDESTSVFEPKKGLSEDVVREISALKSEPKWMLDLRLKSLKHFERRPMPNWGGDLSHIDFSDIYYFIRSTEKQASSWEELPEEIRETYDRLGLPEAEKQRLVSGIAAQYECLAGDTRVWTANRGLVPIKDIETGDQVFALDEETGSFVVAPVKGSAQTDVRQTFEVTVNGQTIRATDNHPFFTAHGWKAVADLRVGDHVAVPDANRVVLDDHVRQIQHESGVGTLVRTDLRVAFARVTAIEPARVEPVYDIEVDGPHNFIAEGMVVHNSEVVYHKVREDLEAQGVLFLDTDTALKQHEDLFREHFTKVIPANDNKFAALNTAVWSGGSFIWVPEGVKVDIPLQAYFRINQQNMGQFERTLIIAEPGSYIHYVEGCTAPIYSSDSLHSAVVEIIVKPGARVRYTTIQNWSNNVYNLVTKRAAAYEDATMEWVDANIGSKLTMKYPAVWLMGRGAKGDVLSVAFAGDGQHQDAGAKMVHHAPDTSSNIVSKSVSQGTGRTSYRGLVDIQEGANRVKSSVVCDALLLDETARSDTYPYMSVQEDDAQIGHEASVSKVGDEQLFYLQSRGIEEAEALAMIVRGFIEPIAKELPMEYAVELNRLISLNMEGSVG